MTYRGAQVISTPTSWERGREGGGGKGGRKNQRVACSKELEACTHSTWTFPCAPPSTFSDHLVPQFTHANFSLGERLAFGRASTRRDSCHQLRVISAPINKKFISKDRLVNEAAPAGWLSCLEILGGQVDGTLLGSTDREPQGSVMPSLCATPLQERRARSVVPTLRYRRQGCGPGPRSLCRQGA